MAYPFLDKRRLVCCDGLQFADALLARSRSTCSLYTRVQQDRRSDKAVKDGHMVLFPCTYQPTSHKDLNQTLN